MEIIFCAPELTIPNVEAAMDFYKECKALLDTYIVNMRYISSIYQLNQMIAGEGNKDDILIFFTSENGEYSELGLKLLRKYNSAGCRIWPIAMLNTPACRKPPEPVETYQSFDVSCRNEHRNPLKNNMKAIAQIFARKIIAQAVSPLYQDEVLYFISHRRSDGENIAAKLADELPRLTSERKVYRDVIRVEVGKDAQEDIDDNLKISDVLIFLQTEEAQQSPYIMKELCYALVYNIPVLWIQIDDADYSTMEIQPGEAPALKYNSKDFDCPERLIEIADEIEEQCFHLMMNSSNQVYTYIEYLQDLNDKNAITLVKDENAVLAYEIACEEESRYLYGKKVYKHYIQCFGRNPKENDITSFKDRVKGSEIYQKSDNLFILSNHGSRERKTGDDKILEENYDDYIVNLENVSGKEIERRNKRIILSGAFPVCDEIYKVSLIEALVVYAKEIIRNGYTLVFGAHPTFQKLIFDIGRIYSTDVKYSIEMHMDKKYEKEYDTDELQKKCTLILSDGLQAMRERMIRKEGNEILICLGGKIKEDKSQQGVDIEVEIAQKEGIPIALVGTVGGRSSEYAHEKIVQNDWSDLNPWDKKLNQKLFYSVNHRMMIRKLLDIVG